MKAKVNNSWMDIPEIYAKVSGNWKQVLAGYTKINGVWKNMYQYIPYDDLVDLGLPSGLLWAKGNIVSDGNGGYKIGNETDYGAYFSWGNIVPHFSANGSTFDNSYNWGSSTSGSPYKDTPGASLSGDIPKNDTQHNAPLALLGQPWRMPTYDEIQELNSGTDKQWATINGVKGYKYMKKSDHSVYIFLPAAGYGSSSSLSNRGTVGRYWNAKIKNDDGKSWGISFNSSNSYPQSYYDRYLGLSIRAVILPT